MKNILIFVSIISLLSACTSNRPSTSERAAIFETFFEAQKLEKINSISSFRLQGWSSIDSEHLIISTSPRRSYLITLNGYCVDLMNAHHIGVNRRNDRTLDARFDYILVPGIIKSKCYIKSIHKISKEQRKELSKAMREKKPD